MLNGELYTQVPVDWSEIFMQQTIGNIYGCSTFYVHKIRSIIRSDDGVYYMIQPVDMTSNVYANLPKVSMKLLIMMAKWLELASQ